MVGRRQFLKTCGRSMLMCAGLDGVYRLAPARASARNIEKGYIGKKVSPYFTALEGGRIRCDLCPHQCEVDDGDRGQCEVRQNIGGEYVSLVYGNPCAVHVDPIEKKPFFHVLPASASFSIATAGCNFSCKFCQNWEISQTTPDDAYNYDLPPEKVVALARQYNCKSIASTYVEPTIFMEYMLDVGRLARQQGVMNVMHSNGFVNEKPLADLCQHLDAACIDLKSIEDDYYRDICGGRVNPVLETLKRLKAHGVHTEIVNLVVPTKNDGEKQVTALCEWIKDALGPDVPVHFSRFHPTYQLKSLPPTPAATLDAARNTALKVGLQYVYLGNVPGHEGENTFCPACGKRIIQRRGYRVGEVDMKDGACRFCGHPVPGIWKG